MNDNRRPQPPGRTRFRAECAPCAETPSATERDWVLSRPDRGWTGTLTGRSSAETPLAGSNDYTGLDAGLSAGLFEGSDLRASMSETNQPGTVTVYDVSGAPAADTVTPGKPYIRFAALSQVNPGTQSLDGNPSLTVDVQAGTYEASLTAITITAPVGLSFARSAAALKTDISICSNPGVRCTAPRADQLRVAINPDLDTQAREAITVPAPALRQTRALTRAIEKAVGVDRTHRSKRILKLRFPVRITDAIGTSTTRTAVIKVS